MCTCVTSVHISFKITTTAGAASYLDLRLEIDSGDWSSGMNLYDKRNDFNFPIVNFPFICSNIPEPPANWLYLSQLIRYSSACGTYPNFIDREWYAIKETATEPMVPTKIALDHFMQVREISIILLWLLCRRFASEE
jgi:hypothetical protein